MILKSDMIMLKDRMILENICNDSADDISYFTALRILSNCLYETYGRKVIVLIDEYDVPLENAYFNNFYDDMINLIRSVFESVLKTNNSLEFAVLTGCLRISKESIFTGLNNLKVNSIRTGEFSKYFGFTESDVLDIVDYYDISYKFNEIKKWYDSYRFISYHDGYENFYHGFLVGLLEYSDEYLVESNRESGTGHNDIIIKNVLTHDKAVVIEIKTVHDNEILVSQCNVALKQIEDRQYTVNLDYEGYNNIIKFGIAFKDKQCMVKRD